MHIKPGHGCPRILAEVKEFYGVAEWRVKCPYCHETHVHSPEPGTRVPHCSPGHDGEYYIFVEREQ